MALQNNSFGQSVHVLLYMLLLGTSMHTAHAIQRESSKVSGLKFVKVHKFNDVLELRMLLPPSLKTSTSATLLIQQLLSYALV
jgi:hypothetical protein